MTAGPDASALAGARLENGGVDLRMSRASIRARLFGGEPEPTRLGRFVIVQRVGTGGMGIVYAAYDPQLDRRVALKVLRNDVVEGRRGKHQQRLLAEARSMAKLSAPNVVTVFEVGTVEEQVFVAMEFVEAPTLRRWVADVKPSPTEIVAVLRAAGRGLVAAHDAGIVHRDFKPENVLVPKEGPVQVTDFGLAIPVDGDRGPRDTGAFGVVGPAASVLTREMAGTPAYMAPEQLRDAQASPATDQFSFCVTLFEALVGRRPFDEAQTFGWAHGDAEAAPASIPDGVDVPARVARAIERGLAVDPTDRHADMRSLLAQLGPRRHSRALVLGVATLSAAGLGVALASWTEARPCPRRGERLVGVWDRDVQRRAAEAFASTGLAFADDAWTRASASVDDYADAWLDAHRDACLASHRGEQSDERLDRRMTCLDARLAELSAVTEVLADADAEVVENALRVVSGAGALATCDDPSNRGLAGASALEAAPDGLAAAIRGASALRRAGRFDDAAARATLAVQQAEAAGDDGVLAYALLALARSEHALARLDAAETALDRAVKLAGRSRQFELVASAALERAELVGVGRGDFEAGLTLAEAAEFAVASAGTPPVLEAELALLQARLEYSVGRFDDGLADAERGLSVLEQHEVSGAVVSDALQLQGTLLYAKGRLDEAQRYGERALALRTEVYGPQHPAVADSLSNLAAVALAGGERVRAVALFGQAVELRSEALGENHPDTAKTLANLGSAKLASGDMDGAREAYAEALRRLEPTAAQDDPRVAAISSNLGGVLLELGEIDDAIATFERVRRVQEASLGPEHPQLAVTLTNLGRARLERGEAAVGRALFEQALRIRADKLGPDHPTTERTRFDMVAALVLERDLKAAGEILGESPPEGELAAQWLLWSGLVDLVAGRQAEAATHLERALALREASSADASALATTRFLLAHALVRTDPARAQALGESASSVASGRPPHELREYCGETCEDEFVELTESD